MAAFTPFIMPNLFLPRMNAKLVRKPKTMKLAVYLLMMFFFSAAAQAQCAMCRASLESEGNTTKAEAVNDGIVYLMVIPYVLVGVVGIIVYRMYRNKK